MFTMALFILREKACTLCTRTSRGVQKSVNPLAAVVAAVAVVAAATAAVVVVVVVAAAAAVAVLVVPFESEQFNSLKLQVYNFNS